MLRHPQFFAFPLVGLLGAALPAGAQTIGKVGAVNPASQSTPPGSGTRVVELGAQIIFKERVTTSASGSLQLAFIDKSTISVGPNSDLVIDEFVYNPATSQGKMTVSLGRGVLRFVGGQVSHNGNAEIRTPIATIGVRGGAGTISHDAKDGTIVKSSYGRFTIATSGGVQEIKRPGFIVTAQSAAAAPSSPQPIGKNDFDTSTRVASSSGSQGGSAPQKPTDQSAVKFSDAIGAASPVGVTPLAGNASQTGPKSVTVATNTVPNTALITQTVTSDTAVMKITPDLAPYRNQAQAAVTTAQSAANTAAISSANAAAAAQAALAAANLANANPASVAARNAAIAAANAAVAAAAIAKADLATANTALAGANSALTAANAATTVNGAQAAANAAIAAANTGNAAALDAAAQLAAIVASAQNLVLAITASNIAPARAFAMNMSAGAGSSFPYLTGAFVAGNGNSVTLTPVLGYRVAGVVSADGLSATPGVARVMQVGFGLSGQGAAQSSGMLVATAFTSPGSAATGNPLQLSGAFFASRRIAATDNPSFAHGDISSLPNTTTVDASLVPTSFTIDPQTRDSNGVVTTASTAREFGGPLTTNNYTYTQTATSTATPTGLGVNRPAVTLNGYVSGVLTTRQFDAAGNATSTQIYRISGAAGAPSDVQITLDPTTSLASATIRLKSDASTTNFRSGVFELGTLNPNAARPRNAYIDYDNFALRMSDDRASTATTTTATNLAYSANNLQALIPWSAVLAQNPGANAQYFPGVAICDCAYSKWGFWSLTPERDTGSGTTAAERGNLIPWVAGQLAAASQIGSSGSATYSGHAIANIYNNGAQYIAAGNFSNTVNFGTQTGTVSISNLDARNYTGTTTLTPGTANFTGTLVGAVGSGGSLRGSFYGPGTPPAEMAGQFATPVVNGGTASAYFGGGIFQAKRP